MRSFQSTVIGLVIVALPVSTFVRTVSYGYSRNEASSRRRTFSFRHTAPAEGISEQTIAFEVSFTTERTEAAISSQLRARGLTRDDAHPDVYIAARWTFQAEYLIYGPYAWWGWPAENRYPNAYSYGAPWYTDPIVVGTLTIEVSNGHGEVLWRGIGQMAGRSHEESAERTAHINREVVQVLKTFPSTGAIGTTGHRVRIPR